MFEPSPTPRLFGLPPGADFPLWLVRGLLDRFRKAPPEALAQVELLVNSARMQRRIRALFDAEGALLLPRIRLVTELGHDPLPGVAPAIPRLRRRLELAQLVTRLAETQPGLLSGTAAIDLAESLATLLSEMQMEGVSPDRLAAIDPADFAMHWQKTLQFIRLVERYFGPESGESPDADGRMRQAVEARIATWSKTPPPHPIILAGSTGSRGATALLMAAVATLPQGAVVLPGFDFDQPRHAWESLSRDVPCEDHPQYRFARLMALTGADPSKVTLWHSGAAAPAPERNRLVSLALRPAPVTDQWMQEGPALDGLDHAVRQLTLIEAPDPRTEATAVALRLREAAETGQSAALVTPDRMLTRRVTAILSRWGIVPDDSGGVPLPLSPPGRFLRHVAELFTTRLTAEMVLTILKHPLCNSTPDARGPHLLFTREFELWLRRFGPVFPQPGDFHAWATAGDNPDADRVAWATWLEGSLNSVFSGERRPLSDWVSDHRHLAERLAAGPGKEGSAALWLEEPGKRALSAIEELSREAPHGGTMNARDYARTALQHLQGLSVRRAETPHPAIMIWGTLEARVQGAELVILGGLNEGTWPQLPPPDPWLSRKMRQDAGLLLPERQIGLSAHDFQQAIGAPEVVLTRALRDSEAETVPARWLNRLTNLLGGLHETGGVAALKEMRARGASWLGMAAAFSAPVRSLAPASRPSPRPPAEFRPRTLPVTAITTLIRDPYAVYARHILRLRPLDPVHKAADARIRGSVLHRIMEDFVQGEHAGGEAEEIARLMAVTDAVLARDAPWPTIQRFWRARIESAAAWIVARETQRRNEGVPALVEESGAISLDRLDFMLTARPDRIDLLHDGRVRIYDYKTGKPPTESQRAHFDKQLLLEAAMAERGAFAEFGPRAVADARYIALRRDPEEEIVDLGEGQAETTWQGLARLIEHYLDPRSGFTARRALFETRHEGDYDHLARFGEWEMNSPAEPEDLP